MREERHAAWVLLGSAVRITRSRGLDRHPDTWTPEDVHSKEVRSRVYWALYTLDTDLTFSIGAPPELNLPVDETVAKQIPVVRTFSAAMLLDCLTRLIDGVPDSLHTARLYVRFCESVRHHSPHCASPLLQAAADREPHGVHDLRSRPVDEVTHLSRFSRFDFTDMSTDGGTIYRSL